MRKILSVLLVLVMVIGLCSCLSPEKSIIGTWKNQTTVLGIVTETKYTFNEDGTGKKTNVVDIAFTYYFDDDKLMITTSALGLEHTDEYSFEFKGDELVLTNEKETINLEKVK